MTERESPYLWSTTALTNGAADSGINWAENQLPSTVNNAARGMMAACARRLKDTNGSLTSAGSANAYTLTINGTQTAYATGHELTFKANFTNTGAATLNVTNADATALGAKAIRGQGDVALVAGQMTSGGVYKMRYDTAANAAAGAWILMNPSITVTGGTCITVTQSGGDLAASLSQSKLTNSLGSPVSLNNTANFFDGPSVAQGTTGVWFASGTVTLTDSGAAATFIAKLWDGTTTVDLTGTTLALAGNLVSLTLSGFFTNPAGNIRISVKDVSATTGAIQDTAATLPLASTINVIRIG